MTTRRTFLKSAAVGTAAAAASPARVFAERAGKTTGYFGVHPFVEAHPDAVFIMFTNVAEKTDRDGNEREGRRFAREVLVPMDESGVPASRLIPIKPNITGGGGNTWETMGIITDPWFVGGVIESMKDLGISKRNFHVREVNCVNWKDHAYRPMIRKTGADLHNMNARVPGIDNERLSRWSQNNDEIDPDELVWVDVPDGVVFRKIPYLRPINAADTFLLNIAKFKAHSMGLTLACKNFQGAVANGYQHFCQKMGSVMTLPPEHRNPDVERDIANYYRRHRDTLPRWDRPVKADDAPDRTHVDTYDVMCQEVWTHRTLDSLSATDFGLHVVEGIYGRDGNFGPGPNPVGNEDNPRGKAWDYMTNIVIFGKNPFKVDIVGKWLGCHEPGDFGFFHIAMERGMLDGLNPMNIPVYHWDDGRAVRKPLDWFTRTPLRTFYLQRNYGGENEPYWHLVDEPFDYSAVAERKPVMPARPETRVFPQIRQTRSYGRLGIEYALPERGSVMVEILNDRGETVAVPDYAVRDAGWHLASWDTAAHDSGNYTLRYRYNGRVETRKIELRKA